MNYEKDLIDCWIDWLNRHYERPTGLVPLKYDRSLIVAIDTQSLEHDLTGVKLFSVYLDLESDVRHVHLVGVYVGDELRFATVRVDAHWLEFFANGIFQNLPNGYEAPTIFRRRQ